jgi:oryzin
MITSVPFSILCTSLLVLLGASPTAQARASQEEHVVVLKNGLSARNLDDHLDWLRGVHSRSLGGSQAPRPRAFSFGTDHVYTGSFDEETLAEIQRNKDVSPFSCLT